MMAWQVSRRRNDTERSRALSEASYTTMRMLTWLLAIHDPTVVKANLGVKRLAVRLGLLKQ